MGRRRVIQQPADAVGKLGRILDVDNVAGLAVDDRVRRAADPRRDHRPRRGRGLVEHPGVAFVHRAEQEGVAGRVEVGNLLVAHGPREDDIPREPEVRDLPLQARSLGAFANHQQERLRMPLHDARHRVEHRG